MLKSGVAAAGRRWARPRFTLRTLLVVTAFVCVAMWIHVYWIGQRRAAIASGQVTSVPILDPSGAEPRPPWLLGWFGEAGQSLLIIHRVDDDAAWERERARLARLFPEAEIRRGQAESIFSDPSSDVRPMRR